MNIAKRYEPVVLLVGDLCVLYLSLWLTLVLRYHEWTPGWAWRTHLLPFTILFAAWVFVFFIAGLYEKHTLLFRSRLPATIARTALFNVIVAVLFFYLIPEFGIAPKTNLFLYLVISTALLLAWRLYVEPRLGVPKKDNALLIGAGNEMREVEREINGNPRYSMRFSSVLDLDRECLDFERDILEPVRRDGIAVVVIDIESEKVQPLLGHLYELVFVGVRFVDLHNLYEDIFDRVPLSLVRYNWFLENISASHAVYDFLKRAMDVLAGGALGLVSLLLYPFVILAIKLDDGGPIFSRQQRVGQGGRPVTIVKFRTMTLANDEARWGMVENKVTRVGTFLRKSRLDELPQLWNVIAGDISLIGPRPEFERPVKDYSDAIPYYGMRHIIKPGLSGWAQIYHEGHPHHELDIEETRRKLSYDLYYIKNRSLVLDMAIALKTMKALLSRSGR